MSNESSSGELGNRHEDELAEIISKLESCLDTSERAGLTLLCALVDHALAEAKRHREM